MYTLPMLKCLTFCRFLLRAGTWKKMSDVTECIEHTTKSYRNSSSTGQDILWSTAKKKISLAMDINKSSIKPSDTGGVFEVKSESSSRQWYRLQLGDKEGISSLCECEAWQRRHLPCKHFFAIFKHFPEWNWAKLPQNYRNSPYLTLDYDLLNGSSPLPSPSSVLPEANGRDSPQLDETRPKIPWLCSKENVSPIPETAIPIGSTHHQKKSEGKKCCIL